MAISEVSINSMLKWMAGNDVWALAVVKTIEPEAQDAPINSQIQEVLKELQYTHKFKKY
jgi:hypothetical protein